MATRFAGSRNAGQGSSTLIVGGGCTSGHDDAHAVWWAAPTRRGVGTRTKPGAYSIDSDPIPD
jgi:hypothetical protein